MSTNDTELMEPTCEQRQIALEMLRYGARTPVDADELEHHVASCAECAAYAEVSRRAEELLALPELERSSTAVEVMRRKVKKQQLHTRLNLWLYLLFDILLVALYASEHWPYDDSLFVALLVGVAIPNTLYLLIRWENIARAEFGDLAAYLRKDVKTQLRIAATCIVWMPLFFGGIAVYVVCAGFFDGDSLALPGVLYGICIASSTAWFACRYRALRRELLELDSQPPGGV